MRLDADQRQGVFRAEVDRQRRKLDSLEVNQAHLVQLSYKGLVSDAVPAREQRRLEAEQRQARKLLRDAEIEMQDVDAPLEEALARTNTPHANYLVSTPLERRMLAQAFFEKLFIGADAGVHGVELTARYQAIAAWDEAFGRYVASNPGPESEPAPGDLKRKPRSRFWGPGFTLESNGGGGGNRTPNSGLQSRRVSVSTTPPGPAANGRRAPRVRVGAWWLGKGGSNGRRRRGHTRAGGPQVGRRA
jgi:hypothetical protein